MKTKSLIVFFSLYSFIIGCKNVSEMEQNKMESFGKNYTEAWNSQKPENVASFFASDGSLIVNNNPPLVGRKDITKFVYGFMTSFPDMKLIMDSLLTKSNSTEYHWTFIGTNTGPNGTGNRVKFSGMELWKINIDGLIQKSIGSFDAEEYNRQVEHGIDN